MALYNGDFSCSNITKQLKLILNFLNTQKLGHLHNSFNSIANTSVLGTSHVAGVVMPCSRELWGKTELGNLAPPQLILRFVSFKA